MLDYGQKYREKAKNEEILDTINMFGFFATDSNEKKLLALLTEGILRTDKIPYHNYFLEPEVDFDVDFEKVINISYMCHSSILCGDSTATISFDLPWFICINFLHPVGSSCTYREADQKL